MRRYQTLGLFKPLHRIMLGLVRAVVNRSENNTEFLPCLPDFRFPSLPLAENLPVPN